MDAPGTLFVCACKIGVGYYFFDDRRRAFLIICAAEKLLMEKSERKTGNWLRDAYAGFHDEEVSRTNTGTERRS